MNNKLRNKIIDIIVKSGEGHIPSSFSILDIIFFLYKSVLKNISQLDDVNRDYFVLSKGHGAAALYVVLNEMGLLTDDELDSYGSNTSNLGGHPDMTKISHIEASTGSLGHGFPTAMGIAFGLKIRNLTDNCVYVLLGDGECHEGTIWETANIASNNNLNNLVALVDWNKSAQQLMPNENLLEKWKAFGWRPIICDGHSENDFEKTFQEIEISRKSSKKPHVIILDTTKGKGVSFIEGHGKWHHKIPNKDELLLIRKELNEKT